MQAVERGKAGNRRLDQVRELADVGLFSAVLEDDCELIQLLHGYVVATKSVCEWVKLRKFWMIMRREGEDLRCPYRRMSIEFFFSSLQGDRGGVKKS